MSEINKLLKIATNKQLSFERVFDSDTGELVAIRVYWKSDPRVSLQVPGSILENYLQLEKQVMIPEPTSPKERHLWRDRKNALRVAHLILSQVLVIQLFAKDKDVLVKFVEDICQTFLAKPERFYLWSLLESIYREETQKLLDTELPLWEKILASDQNENQEEIASAKRILDVKLDLWITQIIQKFKQNLQNQKITEVQEEEVIGESESLQKTDSLKWVWQAFGLLCLTAIPLILAPKNYAVLGQDPLLSFMQMGGLILILVGYFWGDLWYEGVPETPWQKLRSKDNKGIWFWLIVFTFFLMPWYIAWGNYLFTFDPTVNPGVKGFQALIYMGIGTGILMLAGASLWSLIIWVPAFSTEVFQYTFSGIKRKLKQKRFGGVLAQLLDKSSFLWGGVMGLIAVSFVLVVFWQSFNLAVDEFAYGILHPSPNLPSRSRSDCFNSSPWDGNSCQRTRKKNQPRSEAYFKEHPEVAPEPMRDFPIEELSLQKKLEIAQTVCHRKGYDGNTQPSCSQFLLAICMAESGCQQNSFRHETTYKNGKYSSYGYFQIMVFAHLEHGHTGQSIDLNLNCAYDFECAATWTLEYAIKNGYPNKPICALYDHNGAVSEPKRIRYEALINRGLRQIGVSYAFTHEDC